MAKKIFARARLVKSVRWKIDFIQYDTLTGKESRHRREFDLNDIEDLAVREAVALRICQNIDLFAARPEAEKPADVPVSDGPSLKQCVELAVQIKQGLPRKSSRRRYITVSKPFIAWIRKKHLHALPVGEFTRKNALEYWDELTTAKKYRGKTLNNYLDAFRSIWNVLQDRELTGVNPWERIKPVREEEKQRRPFTPEERREVARYAAENDYWIFRGILLQYYCYVRPVELCRLKFRDFDFKKGTLTVREADAKQYRRSVKTIPSSILKYFVDGRFERYPANFYMYGRSGNSMEPSATPVDEMRPYKRHARILQHLKVSGKLPGNISGLSWYSWKDSGISTHSHTIGMLPTKDQAGHRNLNITSIYYRAPEINEAYKSLDDDLLL